MTEFHVYWVKRNAEFWMPTGEISEKKNATERLERDDLTQPVFGPVKHFPHSGITRSLIICHILKDVMIQRVTQEFIKLMHIIK